MKFVLAFLLIANLTYIPMGSHTHFVEIYIVNETPKALLIGDSSLDLGEFLVSSFDFLMNLYYFIYIFLIIKKKKKS